MSCHRIIAIIISLMTLSSSLITPVFALHLPDGQHAVVQLGAFRSHAGQSQNIAIADLIGDRFTVSSQNDNNVMVGLGYFFDGQTYNAFTMSYGINAFYLAQTTVKGNVIQEGLFNNLSYQYKITNVPVYAVLKSTINLNSPKYELTVDAGVGPNFMRAGSFHEYSLDGGLTLPDHIFSSNNLTTFSATVGLGIKFNNAFKNVPVECGYRFFYLGSGGFNKTSSQVLNSLNTGNTYANAVTCSVLI